MSDKEKNCKTILFVSYGGGHAKAIVPVIRKLIERDDYKVIVFALTTANIVMKKYSIPYVSYKDFSYLVSPQVFDIGKKLVGSESKSISVPYDESIYYHGVNMLELVEVHGEFEAYDIYKKYGRHSFYPKNFMSKVLRELNVELLVSTNSPRTEKAAIDAANSLKIKSLCIVDLFAKQEISWIGKKGFATKVCVLNQSVKDALILAERMKNEVIVTGNPSFDNLMAKNTISRGMLLQKNNGWNKAGSVTLLYASQPEPEKHPFNNLVGDVLLPQKIEFQLREFVQENKQYNLVIRYHPSENRKFVEQERVFLSRKEEELHSLLHAIDIVIVTTSTVGLEASMVGKAVISVDTSIFTEDAPYSKMGISDGVFELKFLKKKILSVYHNLPKTKEVVAMSHTSATDNVISVIDSLTK